MDTFEDLGIAPELAAAAESLGWDAPRGLQRDALPVIRRGNNVVLHASAGSGAAGAYGLGLLDRLLSDPAPDDAGPLALVLVPDSASASRTAASLARLAASAGLPVRALAPGWPVRQAHVLVASPTAAMEAVRGSRLKLEGLRALVVDAADQMDALGQWEEIETLVDIVPSDAQRVVTAGTLGDRVDGFIDRHARRAMTIPPRSDDHEDPSADAPTVGYAVVPEHDKAVALVPLLQAAEADEVAVVCRTHARADDLRSALEARGAAGDLEDRRVLVLPLVEADQRTTRAHVISADVPFDAGALAELHGRGGDVLVTPRERAHLLRIARQAGIRARPLPDADARGTEPAEVIRERIRTLLASADLSADLGLVEPLLDEHPAAEVAAAALHLARGATTGPRPSGPDVPAGASRAGPAGHAATAPPPSTTWMHLFISGGSRDGITAGDIVGAITGEAGVPGDRVGKIEIRESHTTAEVATEVADQVIRSLNGRTLKGRSLRVDYDRRSSGGSAKGGRGGGKPRGTTGPRGGGGRGGSRGKPPGGRRSR